MKVALVLLALTLLICIEADKQVHQKERVITTAGKAFYLSQPSSLSRVLRLYLHSDSDSIQCQSLSHQLYTQLHTQFTLPSLLSNFDSLEWQTQIVSVCRGVGGLWVMQSNGYLLWLEVKEQLKGRWEEVRSYRVEGRRKGWIEGNIFCLGGQLIFWKGAALKTIELIQGYWRQSSTLLEGEILQVKQDNNQFFILTNDTLYMLNSSLLPSAFNLTIKTRHKHMTVTKAQIILLSGDNLVIVDRQSHYCVSIGIEEGKYAQRLTANEHYIIVYFQRHKQIVIRQYLRPTNATVVASIIHRKYQSPRQMFLFNQTALIFQNYQLIIFQLNFTFTDLLSGNDVTLRSQNLQHIEQLDSGELRMLMVADRTIRQVTVSNLRRGVGLFEVVLMCNSEQVGENQVQIKYEGVCQQDQGSLCQLEVDYSISTYENEENQIFRSAEVRVIYFLTICAVIFTIAIIQKRRKLKREIEEHKVMMERRRQLSQNSIVDQNVSVSMSPTKHNTK